MDISIVIVGWNAKRYLELCLESLAAAPPTRSMEIIVVDNASSDGSAEMIENKFPHVKLIRSLENLGFAKGNNVAIRQSQGRYITLVNPDAQVLPGCLDSLADFLDQNPKVGNVGPHVLNPDMTHQNTCRQFPNLWNTFCVATGLATAFKKSRIFSGEHMFYFPHDRSLAVDVLVGCFWMIRREALEDVGLLDEDFFVYGEDLDWCRRCWKAGWKVVLFPGAEAIHYRGGSSGIQPVRCAVVQQQSILHYWSKHHGRFGLLGIKSILVFHHTLRCLFSVATQLFRSSKSAGTDVRIQASKACLHDLLSGAVPRTVQPHSPALLDMSISTSISRIAGYYRRNGLWATAHRTWLALSRALFSNRMVLFYCDLCGQISASADLPSPLKVERKRSETELAPQDLQEIVSFWNPELTRHKIKERFGKGASLWILKSERKMAGFGWTLQGHTVEPHYFHIGQDDVHLFDFLVFPQFRGHGLNPLLVNHILRRLAAECGGRAFIEAAEWNEAQLRSLGRTPFRRLGSAMKSSIFRCTLVYWGKNETEKQSQTIKFTTWLRRPVRRTGSRGN
jgi:GT2 family glycosyltransferase/GNAT superfamily N-acetyltransferase